MDILTFSMLCAILYIAPNNITPLGERPATVQASLVSAPPSTSQTHLLRRLMHGSTNMAATIGLPLRDAQTACVPQVPLEKEGGKMRPNLTIHTHTPPYPIRSSSTGSHPARQPAAPAALAGRPAPALLPPSACGANKTRDHLLRRPVRVVHRPEVV